ncbi:MAG: TIGR03619 family F420-dependent LLM class oxidoreductase [Proteobacteria bacterium]|nr:TIGR03619 family F420-dependent LLM class oxidoreductase [Pseudomonadota bacterium]
MKFSVSLPTGFEGVMHPVPFVKPEDFVALGQLCERLGYHSAWGNDHINTQRYVREKFPDTPPAFYEVMLTLGHVAATTTRLKVGTAVAVLPMRDPAWLAKETATLDQLSGGRLILGVGVGAYREEFAAWAPRLKARRGDLLDEGLAVLRAAFTERVLNFEGKHYAYRDLEMFPKPRQNPFPIFIGGHNLNAVERAARWGAGWLPGWRPWPELAERIQLLKRRAAELGRAPGDIEIAPQFSVTLAKTAEAAEQRYMASDLVAHRISLNYTGRDLSQQVTANLVGSPELVREKVGQLAEIGVDHCCALMFPADTVAEMREQIEWFAETMGLSARA